MNKLMTVAAAAAVSAALLTGAPRDAKADGGAVAIGVAAYLITDAVVGHECKLRTWPFNIIHKIGRELHGKSGCRRASRRR
jgi:hypothetical protein